MENTPGPGGYLLAWAVSLVVCAGLATVDTSVSDGSDLGTAFGILATYIDVIGWLSIPFALVGVGLVHLACRNVRRQGVHIAAAGLAGLLPAVLMGALLEGHDAGHLALIPVATAIGRWSVVPLVRRRRETALRPGVRATR